jgi:hypothetical protein
VYKSLPLFSFPTYPLVLLASNPVSTGPPIT